MKKIGICIGLLVLPLVAFGTTTKKQSAIQNGTNVRAKVSAKGIYDQECYDEYYGCMDSFCISDNINGGSCACSDNNTKYEAELDEINQMLANAERIRDVEVEKIKLGANADIVFGGKRTYDAQGNVVYNFGSQSGVNQTKEQKRADLLKLFDTNLDDDDETDDDNIMDKTGVELFNAANETCTAQIGDKCSKDMKILRQIYQRQIESDCRGFANSIAQQRAAAQTAINNAESDVRNALKESFDSANKYNQGECMVELKKCMVGTDACGADWENCVFTVASENMQNNRNKNTQTKTKYDISKPVLERLESKRTICERVLDQCMAVRDTVWTAFLREIAPTLKLAELRAESNLRQSCLTDITQCIHTACKDNIAGKGTATMDSCLSRPDMARSFCKVQLDPCENMEPQIWSYVKDKLLAMRVDACTNEVKDCFMDESRCGPDFMNCIGMDYAFIHEMCPVDSLVTCKAYNKDQGKEFTMDDIDKIVMGLYLNIDNKALENCQKLVENKMTEICGSTSDCNRFASDDTIGTGSLRSVKDGNIYRITGMISFGSIKVGDGHTTDNGETLEFGKIGVTDYMANARANNQDVPEYETILNTISAELNDIAGSVNRVIDMIASDPQIQFCVNGRDLSQIDPNAERTKTNARFPHLLDQVKMQIAIAALRQAQTNYQAKYNEYLADATKNASIDIAQYMCQMLPVSGGAPVGRGTNVAKEETHLAPPYAISYEVSTGLNNKLLAQGGRSESAIATQGTATRTKVDIPNGTREMWSTFNRNTRICRLCSSTITKDCTSTVSNGFIWIIGAYSETNCTESDPIEKCDDIEM